MKRVTYADWITLLGGDSGLLADAMLCFVTDVDTSNEFRKNKDPMVSGHRRTVRR